MRDAILALAAAGGAKLDKVAKRTTDAGVVYVAQWTITDGKAETLVVVIVAEDGTIQSTQRKAKEAPKSEAEDDEGKGDGAAPRPR